jgi:hypothetical protein
MEEQQVEENLAQLIILLKAVQRLTRKLNKQPKAAAAMLLTKAIMSMPALPAAAALKIFFYVDTEKSFYFFFSGTGSCFIFLGNL